MDKKAIKEIIWGAIIESFDAESINGKKDYKAAVLDRAIKRIEALPTPDAVGITDEEIERAAIEEFSGTSGDSLYGEGESERECDAWIAGAKWVRSLLSSKQTEAERILRELVRLKDLKDWIEEIDSMNPAPVYPEDYKDRKREYNKIKPGTWQAARQWCIDNPEKV